MRIEYRASWCKKQTIIYELLCGCVFVDLIQSRYTLLGQLESKMQSIASTVATQYPETLGEFNFDGISDEGLYQSWRYGVCAPT